MPLSPPGPRCRNGGLALLTVLLIALIFLARPGSAATTKGELTADQGQEDRTMSALNASEAVTVRALIAFNRLPSTVMGPLTGLRGRGVDVLGATADQLKALLNDPTQSFSSEEKVALTHIVEVMAEVAQNAQPSGTSNRQDGLDHGPDALSDEDDLDQEVARIIAEPLDDRWSGATSDPDGGPEPAGQPNDGSHAGSDARRTPAGMPGSGQAAGSLPGGAAMTDPQRTTPSLSAPADVDRAAIPALHPAPFLDVTTLTRTQWDGAVTAAMEGMRMVYGPMSAEEEDSFRKKWGVLRQFPSPEAVEYLNQFNPLLGEFLSLRGAVADAGMLMEQAVEHVSWAAEADDPVLAMEYLAMARKYRNIILSCQKRLDDVVSELIALGDPPDGAELMAQGQEQYKRAKDFLRGLLPSGPEGQWVGYIVSPTDAEDEDEDTVRKSPFHFLIYAFAGDYYAIALDTDTYDEKEHQFVESLDLHHLRLLDGIQGDTLNHSLTDDEGETWTVHAVRYNGGAFPEFADLSERHFQEELGKNDHRLAKRLEEAQLVTDPVERTSIELGASVAHRIRESFIKTDLAQYRIRPSFFAAAAQWAAMPDSMPADESARLRRFDALVAQSALPHEDGATTDQQADNEAAPQTKPVPAANAKDETPLHMVDDKTADERRILDQESIDFHAANIGIIERNMAKDQAELNTETDPDRRHDLEMRILHARANISSELDRIESLKTGVVVHTRSEWDDFAKSQFIQSIAEDQRKMERVSRGMRKAMAMADTLPYEEAQKVREIVSRGFNPEVMAATDTEKASQIIRQAYEVATGHWEAEKKKADADAEWADTCLQTALMTKSVADRSLMVLSFVGGSGVNRVYQGAVGYVEGGPKEVFLRVANSYNQVTSMAVDGFRGFEAAVESGGGLQDAFFGAGWEVVKGLAMEQAMKLTASGVARGYGAIKTRMAAGNVTPGKTTAETSTAALTRKPTGVPDDGFNRPLTESDRQAYKAQMSDARTRVNSYKKTFDKLQQARKQKAPPAEIKKILRELDDRSAKIHASPQAKMIMKTHQRNPGNKEMVKRYVNSMDRVHNRVEKQFHSKMNAEWDAESLAPIRNAESGKSVNMDYDIARQVRHDAQGRPIAPRKNGKPVPESLWQAEAQKKWEESYREVTGQDPKRSWETVTTGSHPEAYRDLAVIEKNGVLRANKDWAGQTSDVNQFKGDHLRSDPNFTRVEKHVEVARSTSKECERRLLPLMESKTLAATDTANLAAFNKHKDYWTRMNAILTDMGSGRIDPLEGDRRVRLLSGGKSSLEVTHDLRDFFEAMLKFDKP